MKLSCGGRWRDGIGRWVVVVDEVSLLDVSFGSIAMLKRALPSPLDDDVSRRFRRGTKNRCRCSTTGDQGKLGS